MSSPNAGPIMMLMGIGGTGTISIVDAIENDAKFWGLVATVSGIAVGAAITIVHNIKTRRENERHHRAMEPNKPDKI